MDYSIRVEPGDVPGQEGPYWAHWKPGGAMGHGWELVRWTVLNLSQDKIAVRVERFNGESLQADAFDMWLGPFPEPPHV